MAEGAMDFRKISGKKSIKNIALDANTFEMLILAQRIAPGNMQRAIPDI